MDLIIGCSTSEWIPGMPPAGDPRPAAEIMTEELSRIWRGHVPASANRADGPAASQIFSAAVMREQVDP